jgi:hypothetical protein
MANEKYPIKQEWTKYYNALEVIRETGITNMFGAAPYLREVFPELSRMESNEILCNWMENYDTLSDMFNWR